MPEPNAVSPGKLRSYQTSGLALLLSSTLRLESRVIAGYRAPSVHPSNGVVIVSLFSIMLILHGLKCFPAKTPNRHNMIALFMATFGRNRSGSTMHNSKVAIPVTGAGGMLQDDLDPHNPDAQNLVKSVIKALDADPESLEYLKG